MALLLVILSSIVIGACGVAVFICPADAGWYAGIIGLNFFAVYLNSINILEDL